jgi:tRNA A37 methylthiotransferase MiaB
VETAEAEKRAGAIMQVQAGIAAAANQALQGKTVKVICDAVEGKNAVGRVLDMDAPEIDNTIYLTAKRRLHPGEVVMATVTEAKTFDLYAIVC